ncbi:hypothetical protein [Singulisphaera sp. PoT]|uniref:hypothetical protein n=1 Tax=Singulisphaera sp. PoT TaxID=3411797 RepID=UPI003BF4DCFB
MAETIEGVIHGNTIELRTNPGLADGQRVEVKVRVIASPEARIDAILKTAGSLAHLPQDAWDDLDQIIREREGAGRHREISE